MSNFDYILEAQAIRDQLVGDQMLSWKMHIDEAIEGGATGTEILMALRWTIAECLKENPDIIPDVVARMKDYIMNANKLLG